MNMQPVKSGWIDAIGYDSETRQLVVRMRGKDYTHTEVPSDVADAFSKSESKGRFYINNIKGKFGLPEGTGA